MLGNIIYICVCARVYIIYDIQIIIFIYIYILVWWCYVVFLMVPLSCFKSKWCIKYIYIYSTYRIIITDPTRLCVVGIEEYSMHQLRGTSRPWPGSKRPSQNSTTDIPSWSVPISVDAMRGRFREPIEAQCFATFHRLKRNKTDTLHFVYGYWLLLGNKAFKIQRWTIFRQMFKGF